MSEILFSFFAVLGIVFFFTELYDLLNYRKKKFPAELRLNLNQTSETELDEIMEWLCAIRQSSKGRCLTDRIVIILDENQFFENAWFFESLERMNIQTMRMEDKRTTGSYQKTPSRESTATLCSSESEFFRR